ncbi:MAG TPA: hypothetical protein VH951_02135 [Dehalococcoidia bacterium]
MHVLVLSSSTVNFEGPDGAPSLLALVATELRATKPETEWSLSGELLFTTDSMASRAMRLLDRHQPDIVILRPTGLSFLHDDVASRVRERWPYLYRVSLSVARYLDRISGGRARDRSYGRRLLFGAPRWLAARVVGVAPPVSAETCAAYTADTIDRLAALETFDLLCRIAVGNVDSNVPEPERTRRVETYAESIRVRCSERRIPFADNRDLLRAVEYDYAADRIHPGSQVRALEARALAADILQRMNHVTPAGSSV